MRIITGHKKGKVIRAPRNLPVRPTTDFAKTALFNILRNHFDFSEVRVLDLFCGTGNISYEFLSQGCINVTCVDSNSDCIRFVKESGEKMFPEKLHVIRSDAFRFVKNCKNKFNEKRYNLSLHSKVVFYYTLLFWLIGTILILLIEFII